MKFTIALPLAFAALGLAAPTQVEKRLVGQLTLYKGASYTGQSVTFSVDTEVNDGCGMSTLCAFKSRWFSILTLELGRALVVRTGLILETVAIPSGFNNQVVSVQINPQLGAFFCRLHEYANPFSACFIHDTN